MHGQMRTAHIQKLCLQISQKDLCKVVMSLQYNHHSHTPSTSWIWNTVDEGLLTFVTADQSEQTGMFVRRALKGQD